MIPDEPVRGRTPPRWIGALSGIERCRAYSRGLLPSTPMARLLGLRTTHVAAGTLTLAMPASDAHIAGNGQLEICPAMIAALEGASHTALPAGFDVIPLRFTRYPFRPAWPGRGNVLARARVVNNSNLFVFADVHVEDSEGRYIAQGGLNSAVMRIDPPPPQVPENMEPVHEPVYDTPDPYLRSFRLSPLAELMEREDGLGMLREFQEGRLALPAAELYGLRLESFGTGRLSLSIPASEWFCAFGSHVSPQALAAFADMALFSGVVGMHTPGRSLAVLGTTTTFLRQTPADGRRLYAEVITSSPARWAYDVEARIRNEDDELVVQAWSAVGQFDDSRRQRRKPKAARRILATLLFLDIVDSTGHATRLGDATWRALLDDYRLKLRRELSRFNGIEVDTAGDGFFVRFDSPAYAIEAARAAIAAAAGLRLELRAGIHTGECELEGNRLAGMAVHVGARVMSEAGPGEVLVTSTVKELTAGAGFRFEDRGARSLKGVPEPWQVYAAEG